MRKIYQKRVFVLDFLQFTQFDFSASYFHTNTPKHFLSVHVLQLNKSLFIQVDSIFKEFHLQFHGFEGLMGFNG